MIDPNSLLPIFQITLIFFFFFFFAISKSWFLQSKAFHKSVSITPYIWPSSAQALPFSIIGRKQFVSYVTDETHIDTLKKLD